MIYCENIKTMAVIDADTNFGLLIAMLFLQLIALLNEVVKSFRKSNCMMCGCCKWDVESKEKTPTTPKMAPILNFTNIDKNMKKIDDNLRRFDELTDEKQALLTK
jgi:hypothetical protein